MRKRSVYKLRNTFAWQHSVFLKVYFEKEQDIARYKSFPGQIAAQQLGDPETFEWVWFRLRIQPTGWCLSVLRSKSLSVGLAALKPEHHISCQLWDSGFITPSVAAGHPREKKNLKCLFYFFFFNILIWSTEICVYSIVFSVARPNTFEKIYIFFNLNCDHITRVGKSTDEK